MVLYSNRGAWLRLLPAALVSGVMHAAFVFLFALLPWNAPRQLEAGIVSPPVQVEMPPPEEDNPFKRDVGDLSEPHPFSPDSPEPVLRLGALDIPGLSLPGEMVGASLARTDVLMPGGGVVPILEGPPRKGLRAGSTDARSGDARVRALERDGGTTATEAAVGRGLRWLIQMQTGDGSWRLDDPRFGSEAGAANDVAGTALGLLPLLGAGKTPTVKAQEADELEKKYAQAVHRGLLYLVRVQNKATGQYSTNMYAHGLATIAMSEAYGLTQNPALRKSAQMAVNYLVYAQHEGGGWRYAPREPGDTSVVGWQAMGLKSGQMAGLAVPQATLGKVNRFLDGVRDLTSEGYGYTDRASVTPARTAIGLLCRQYLQAWGPKNPGLQKAIDILRKNPPTAKDMYYTYYATQVMHHFGGEDWVRWNEQMRPALVDTQIMDGPMKGSWSTAGVGGHISGKLMQTSLCICTLEVYYRYLPLYARISEYEKSADQSGL
jgi:hypothetical protein